MEQKSEKGNLNEAIKEKFSKAPDPLHFELPHTHKKLLEVIYVLVVIGAILLILVFNNMGVLTYQETNAGVMIVLLLSVMLLIMLLEKATVHRPTKSAS